MLSFRMSTHVINSLRIFRELPELPNAALGLRLIKRVSVPQIRDAIHAETGITIHIPALRRFERHGVGLGKKKREALARYFGVTPFQLLDPDYPFTIDPSLREKLEKILPETVINY